ncbi:hypothetical protein [Halobacillus litoralis]|uniref:hypothetical protein n=1 Tax=Halobacillus litoralis TaxID=45668 RepID=UPI001CD1A0A4|nr:hypothetical protein [Halobacillus litoralis]MCA1021523.1 hypothetical protein [Halobacillus litoralis]
MSVKNIFYNKSLLGRLGEQTGSYAIEEKNGQNQKVELRVGDVVSFYKYKRIYTKVVVKNSSKHHEYGIFGFGTNDLSFDKMTRVLSYEDLTEDILQKLQENLLSKRSSFAIKETSEREMTLGEIEKELGYKIKIKSN